MRGNMPAQGRPRSATLIVRLSFLLALLFVPAFSSAEDHVLKLVKQIGPGWDTGKWGWMSFVAFSPDGTMVAADAPAAPDDVSGNLTLWSFPEGRLIKHLPSQAAEISSDWKYYADAHSVWEMETGKRLISLGKDVYAVHAFSRDGRYVAESYGKLDGKVGRTRVVELATGKRVAAFGRLAARSLAISPDGTILASGHWDAVILRNLRTGEKLGALHGFGRYVEGLSFSNDGKLLAVGTDFRGLQIWDVGRQRRLRSVKLAGGDVSKPAFSPDARLAAVGIYGTGTVWLIDVSSGKVIDHQKVSDLGCGSAAFSPDGRFLITPSTGGLITWPYDRGGTIRVFQVNAPASNAHEKP